LADARARATADAAGHWSATLPAMHAGGPFMLGAQASSGAKEAVSDVVIGDVFLCSGQSNMELSVLRAADSDNEIRNSTDGGIRMLNIAHASSPTALDRFQRPVHWEAAEPQTVPAWSAVCFFYAREIRKSVHVAIGLVHASWGGSNIRPWMSIESLRADGGYGAMLDILSAYAGDPAAGQQRFAREWEGWWRRASHDASGTEPWSPSPAAARVGVKNSTQWRAAPAVLRNWREWGVDYLRDFTGLVWYRTTIRLSAAQARASASLALGAINQVDQTWINGRAVGNTFGYGTERRYAVPAGVLRAGDNTLVINVLSTYGGGGLLEGGEKRALILGGGESIALDGPWTYRMAPTAVGYPPRAPWEAIGGFGTLFNAMIAPMGNFGFRAVLWYQGESNTGEADTYRRLLTEMMADWRRRFGDDLAFLVVQLPNFGVPPVAPGESGWSDLREAQRGAVAADAHAGLAVTIDIGDAHNLHPTNKQDVGRRLARAARRVVYADPTTPTGPVAQGAARQGREITVDFKDVDGSLVAYSHQGPIGFELCGALAGTCRYVEARIDGSRVNLESPEDAAPTRVRYCWGDSPICTLFDAAGLPAGPFELEVP
jgi:sialate O-acetylesterase